MNLAAILFQIDGEIARLKRARAILSEVVTPALPKKARLAKPAKAAVTAPPAIVAPPRMILVPPKTKRTYRRVAKPAVPESRALSSIIPGTVVFVPKSPVSTASEQPTMASKMDTDALEAIMRQNLTGGVA